MGTAPVTDGPPRPETLRSLVLAGLVVLSTVVAGVAFAGAAAAQDDDVSVGFSDEEPDRDIRIGNLVEPWTIGMAGTDTVTLVFTGRHSATLTDFTANVTVEDTDDDGQVKIGMNTFRAGHTNPWSVEGGEIVEWSQSPELGDGEIINKTLDDDSNYDVYVGPGSDPAAVMDDPSDDAVANVDDGETQGFDPATAPGGAEFETIDSVYRRADTYSNLDIGVSVEGDQVVAQGDTIMLNPWGNGYYGMAQAAFDRSESREEAFLWLIEEGYMHFSVEQTAVNAGDGEPKVLNLTRAVERDALEFDSNQAYGHILLTLRTDEPVFQVGGTGEFVEPAAGDMLHARFAKDKRVDPDVESRSTKFWAERNFSVVRGEVSIQSPVRSLSDGVIGGMTTYAPGTNFTVYVNAPDREVEVFDTRVKKTPGAAEEHLGITPSAGIDEHYWNFSVDLDDVDANTVEVAVTRSDGTLLRAEPPNFVPEVEGEDPIRTQTTAATTDGPGEDEGTTAPPGETTASPGDTTGAPGDTTADPGGGDGGDGGTIPGFTATVALLAVVTAALLARRRD